MPSLLSAKQESLTAALDSLHDWFLEQDEDSCPDTVRSPTITEPPAGTHDRGVEVTGLFQYSDEEPDTGRESSLLDS